MMMKKRRSALNGSNGQIQTHTAYPHRLNFYNTPPGENLTIDEFEAHAVDRLKVLTKLQRVLETAKSPREIETAMRPIISELLPLSMNAKVGLLDKERRKDHYSHFILRLCFCRHAASQADWIRTEVALFRLRFLAAGEQERREFIDSLPLDLRKCTDNEFQSLPANIKATLKEEVFMVDWTRVPDLVGERRVSVHKGTAYIAQEQLLSLLQNEFRDSLETSLKRMGRTVGRLDEQDRLLPIMDHVGAAFKWPLSLGEVEAIDGINAQSVDTADKANMMPMCMSVMHRQNKSLQHAKFQVRNEFTLFLKHMGMPIEEALKYWSTIMTKDKQFDTNVYQFKHRYGVVGAGIKYKPTECRQLANNGDRQNKCGCPFKYMGASDLAQELRQRGVTEQEDLRYIQESNAKFQFHLSCSRVFAVTQKIDKQQVQAVSTPNEYFSKAWELKQGKQGKPATA